MALALRLMALDAVVIEPELRGWLMSERSPEGLPKFTMISSRSQRNRQSSKDLQARQFSTGGHFAQA